MKDNLPAVPTAGQMLACGSDSTCKGFLQVGRRRNQPEGMGATIREFRIVQTEGGREVARSTGDLRR